MDYEEVVVFALDYLKKSSIVGEGVIRDLRSKSGQMGWSHWMQYFKGSVSAKTYAKIRNEYVEHGKPDYGFTPMDDGQVSAMESFYADPWSVTESN